MLTAYQGQAAPHPASSQSLPEDAALDFLRRLKTPCHLLVAYSGGGDSTALLVVLAERIAAGALQVRLSAATVDHGLRPEATEEARAAGHLCLRLGVAHEVLRWEGDKPSSGLQAAARAARYRLLADHAKAIGAELVVAGHTLDDQYETLAMRQARNPQSLGGMSALTLYDRDVWIARPLLGVSRSSLRTYLGDRGVGWVDDPSNDNEAFERVRVRKASPGDATFIDFAALNAARHQRLAAAAQLLETHAKIYSTRVGVMDLAAFPEPDEQLVDAIVHLVACIGGRSHLAGRESRARISHYLQSGEGRLAIERVVLDRRGHRLFLVRERRLLPEAVVAAGETIIWDNRFRVVNEGKQSVTIAVRRPDVVSEPLLAPLLADLPNGVRQRAAASEPVLVGDGGGQLRWTPILANFDQFLPIEAFEIANVLAKALGLDHFPLPPLR